MDSQINNTSVTEDLRSALNTLEGTNSTTTSI